jgi:hypothetical protein
MAVRSIAELLTDMPANEPGAITATDIRNFIETVEARTTQAVSRKTASYTATVNDNRLVIIFNAASAVTLTLPNTLPEGWECGVLQMGAGQVTISVAGSPPISRGGHTKTAGQYAMASVFVESNASGTAAVVILGGDTSA